VTFWEKLATILAPLALRGAEFAVDHLSRHTVSRRPHYYRSVRRTDGSWVNDDQCGYCPRVDPLRRLYTDPPCPGPEAN
jgi:hypothetical protein